jgi:hypothetical protein
MNCEYEILFSSIEYFKWAILVIEHKKNTKDPHQMTTNDGKQYILIIYS